MTRGVLRSRCHLPSFCRAPETRHAAPGQENYDAAKAGSLQRHSRLAALALQVDVYALGVTLQLGSILICLPEFPVISLAAGHWQGMSCWRALIHKKVILPKFDALTCPNELFRGR